MRFKVQETHSDDPENENGHNRLFHHPSGSTCTDPSQVEFD